MPWYELQTCRFEITNDGFGRPMLVHPEFSRKKPSLLPAKQIGTVYFELRPGLSCAEAKAVVEALNKGIIAIGIRHLAAGERG
jgi:hypothetical protein